MIVIKKKVITEGSIPMHEMKPLEAGVIVREGDYQGHLVLRTAQECPFEVMDLTDPRKNNCFTGKPDLPVRLLRKGESITIELSNE